MPSPSFADIVTSSSPEVPPVDQLAFPLSYHQGVLSPKPDLLHQPSKRSGKPALYLSEDETASLLKPLALALLLKFQRLHPKMDLVREFLAKYGFSGAWTVGQLDPRHLIVRFSMAEDYALLFTRRACTIQEQSARVIKWTPEFDFRKEAPIAPVWLKFPGLKVHYFNHRVLFSLASAFGKPLKLDLPTYQFTRPSCARVLVELDITASYSQEIWIGSQDIGYWQEVHMEGIPYYCKHCCMFGHKSEACFHANPDLLSRKRTIQGAAAVHQPNNLPPQDSQHPSHHHALQTTLAQPSISSEPANTFQTDPKILDLPHPILQQPPILITDYPPPNSQPHCTPDPTQHLSPIHSPTHSPTQPSSSIQVTPNPLKPRPSAFQQHSTVNEARLEGETAENAEQAISESSESEQETFDDSLLQSIENELHEGWTNVSRRKGRPKGSRELNSLLKEAMHVSNLSSRRASRGHHSS